jgi:hypothetical protein
MDVPMANGTAGLWVETRVGKLACQLAAWKVAEWAAS